ncbi:hypothetical protein HanRHA438_Chr05g0244071 [Helianthus annuus]|nr:hypothetical protein HanRHA438_Chr05g0244071 [Helianthus annuus]
MNFTMKQEHMIKKIVNLSLKNINFRPFLQKRIICSLEQEHMMRKIVNLLLKNINFKPFCKKE